MTTLQNYSVFQALNEVNPAAVVRAVRRCDRDELVPLPMDDQDKQEVLDAAREYLAKSTPMPHKLSDHIYYVFGGTVEQFAAELNTPPEYLDQCIYDGAYWHDGQVLLPNALPRLGEGLESEVYRLVSEHLVYDRAARIHTIELYNRYRTEVAVGGPMSRTKFRAALLVEMDRRGYRETTSVRIGARVARGFMGVALKDSAALRMVKEATQ